MKSRYWRIRGRNGEGVDRSREAWERGEVGIWYGAWSADDWRSALTHAPQNPKKYLDALPQQLWQVSKRYVDTARRFDSIRSEDWVVAYFDDTLHLGRLVGPMDSSGTHPLNCREELFKFRQVADTKAFQLALLPDSYRLVPSAGRGNVHELHRTNRQLLSLLADSDSERAVGDVFRDMSTEEWLDCLGPAGWESLCLGYLILNESYLPTGLAVGRTLPTVDVVGVNFQTGQKILAQCKKDPGPVPPTSKFLRTCQDSGPNSLIYLFAYGGSHTCPSWVRVMARDDIVAWLHGSSGSKYLERWRRQPDALPVQ